MECREVWAAAEGPLRFPCSQSVELGLGFVRMQLGLGVRSPGSGRVLGGS